MLLCRRALYESEGPVMMLSAGFTVSVTAATTLASTGDFATGEVGAFGYEAEWTGAKERKVRGLWM